MIFLSKISINSSKKINCLKNIFKQKGTKENQCCDVNFNYVNILISFHFYLQTCLAILQILFFSYKLCFLLLHIFAYNVFKYYILHIIIYNTTNIFHKYKKQQSCNCFVLNYMEVMYCKQKSISISRMLSFDICNI